MYLNFEIQIRDKLMNDICIANTFPKYDQLYLTSIQLVSCMPLFAIFTVSRNLKLRWLQLLLQLLLSKVLLVFKSGL